MAEISNSVRQRLGARPEPQTHPDADMLTAYVEQALPAGERGQIVEHLVLCSFCREIVALSLPELPEPVGVQPVPARSRFWTWGFRWVGAAAVVAIAVALVVQKSALFERPSGAVSKATETSHTDADHAASKIQPATPITTPSVPGNEPSVAKASVGDLATQSRQSRTPPSGAPLPEISRLQDRVDKKDATVVSTFSSEPVAASYNYQPREAFVNTGIFEEQAASADNRAARDNARSSDSGPANTFAFAPPPSNTDPDTGSEKSFLRRTLPVLNPAKWGAAVLSKAKSVTTPSPAIEALAEGRSAPLARARAPRSFAGVPSGKPPISENDLSTTAATVRRESKEGAAEQLHWSIQDGKLVSSPDLTQWHEAYPVDDGILFRALDVRGHDIWAGGSNQTLVHSWNGGVDWEKLNLGNTASGDITNISVQSGDVKVKTSNGQTLISRDGGKTWTPFNSQQTGQPQQSKPALQQNPN